MAAQDGYYISSTMNRNADVSKAYRNGEVYQSGGDSKDHARIVQKPLRGNARLHSDSTKARRRKDEKLTMVKLNSRPEQR